MVEVGLRDQVLLHHGPFEDRVPWQSRKEFRFTSWMTIQHEEFLEIRKSLTQSNELSETM